MSIQPQSIDLELLPEDNARLANLCGQFDQHLRQLERRLGIEIGNRGSSFRLIGEGDAVRLGEQVLRALYAETAESVLTPETIHLVLQDSGVDALLEQVEDRLPEVVIKTKRGLIRARGPNQQEYLHAILKHDINFGVGPAGTGKTYLAVACAVEALESDRVRRLLLVRPAVEAGERLGFLPGDLAQKIDPYLRPLYDALFEMLGFEKVNKLIERNVIEVAPLAYMRGRAQPLTSRVLTPQGWREMGQLAPGDEVIGSDGQPTEVLNVYPQGNKDVYRVTMTDGASTLACGEHLWAVLTASDKRRGKGTRILETQQMQGNLKPFHYHNYEIPLLYQPVAFHAQNVPIDPYALGLLLGDGCITGKTTPAFCNQDAELVDALAAALKPLGVKPVQKNRLDFVLKNEQGGRGGIIVSNPVTVALRELGLEGTRSETKFIPDLYLHNEPDVRLAVLQGLLDSDGSASLQKNRRCRIQYSTTSVRLRDDVIYLVRSLGGVASFRTRLAKDRQPGFAGGREVCHRHDAYILEIRLPPGMPAFRLNRKAKKISEHGSVRPMRFVKSIEPIGKVPTQCIRVAAKDHLYITDDFILTHNTLNESFIILDEAQNTTPEQMKMFLTRIGFGSTAVITGDVTQVDLPRGQPSGLRQAVEILKDVQGISFTFFNARDVVRHALVQRIVNAYDAFENQP